MQCGPRWSTATSSMPGAARKRLPPFVKELLTSRRVEAAPGRNSKRNGWPGTRKSENHVSENFTVEISARAERDLKEIADYIFADLPQNSDAVKKELRDAIRSLETFSTRFKVFEENSDSNKVVYCMTVRPFQVFYRAIQTESDRKSTRLN